jgi:membrane protease YdiL (CAAX protease family)
MNAVFAAAISGVIFAAVHPQGWAVVPALAAIGAVLALVRQWRGSLVASITAHALHNGMLVTVMVLATG